MDNAWMPCCQTPRGIVNAERSTVEGLSTLAKQSELLTAQSEALATLEAIEQALNTTPLPLH